MKVARISVRSILLLSSGIGWVAVTAFADSTLDQLVTSKKYQDAVAYAEAKLPSNVRTADVWVKVGIAHEELGATEKALACFLVASRMDMKSYDAQLGIARAYNKLNQPDDAVTFAKKALELQATGEASWEYAKACMALKKPAEAQEALERVIQSDPSNAAASRGLAEIYWQQREYKKAIPLLKVAYSSQPNADDAFRIGRSLLEANRLDSAIVYLKDAITRNPSLYEANLALARAYYQDDKFLAAANEYEKIVGKVELSAADQYSLAISQEKTGSPESALKAYRAAAEAFGPDKSPEAITSHLKVGNADLEKKNYESALLHFRYVAAADTQGTMAPDILFLLSDAYSGAGNLAKAISTLEKALAADNKNVEAYARLADLYQKVGMPDKANKMYEKITTISPNDPKILVTMGDYSLKSKKYADALKYYEKSYIIDRNVKAAAGIATAAAALEQWDKAIDAAESAVRLDPSLVEPRVVLSRAYLRSDKFKEAKEQLDSLVDKKPFELEYWKQLAYCCKKLSDSVNMANADKKVVEMDKANVESRLRLGAYELSRREYKIAFDMYKELAALTPQNPEVFKSLYEITLNSGDKASAAFYLKKYIAFTPSDAAAQRDLGILYNDAKNYDAALIAFRAAIKLDPAIKGVYKPYAEIVMAKGLGEELGKALQGAVAAGEADANMYAALALVYQKQGNCAKAIDLYQSVLAKDPKNVPALSGLAQCQAKTGDVDAAAASYGQVLALNPAAIDEYKALGDLYAKQNKDAEAAGMYEKYLDKRKDDVKVARQVGDYAFKRKNYDEAARYFAIVSGEDAKKPDFLLHYGQACYYAKDYKKASAIMGELAVLTPLDPEVFRLLYAIAQTDTAQKDEAAGYLRKYLALKPSDAQAQKSLGDILYDRKETAGALTAYRKALAADPAIKGIFKRYFELATAHGVQSDINAALTGAINAGEADAGMYAAQGNYYQRQGLCPKAIQMYRKALAADPKNTAVLMSLGACQVKVGSAAEASVTYEQVLAFNPQEMRVYKMLGEMYLQQKKPDQAIAVYKKYLEKQPKDDAVAYLIGEDALKNKNYDEAVKYFGMIAGEDARKPAFINMYGQACLQKKDYEKAKELYRRLAAAEPGNADVYKSLYDIAMQDNEKDTAISYLKKYLAINPRDARAQKDLGDYLYDRKDLSAAFFAYRTALSADTSVKGVYKRYAELVVARGTTEEMLPVLAKAVSSGEADASVYATLGSIYEKKLLLPKAIANYNKALSLDQRNTQILSSLARCQLKSGNTADAIVSYQQVVAIDPDATQECRILGDLYMKQHKKEDALDSYKKYLAKATDVDPDVAMLVAEDAFEKKEYEDAIKLLGKAVKAKGQDAEFLYLYGRAYYYAKDYRKSADILERLYALSKTGKAKNPHNAVMLVMLADAYDKSGENANAVNAYAAYTKLPEVNDPEASFRMAQIEEALNPAMAAKMYEQNALKSPRDYRNYLGAGLLYAKQPANLEKAAALLKKGLALKDTLPLLWIEIGKIYGKLGKTNQEIEAYQRYIQRDLINPDACEEIGVVLFDKRLTNDAMVFLEMANALKANTPDYMYWLARGYVKTGRLADALPLLEKAEKLKPDDERIRILYNLVLQKTSSGATAPGK